MKLRLPNKLQAALVAAIASVSLTTLSTGSTAQADTLITTTFSGDASSNPNWQANSTSSFDFLSTDDWTLIKISDGTAVGNKTIVTGQLRPNTNVQNSSGWKLAFDVNNTGSDAVTLTGITINSFLFNGQNNYQSNNTERHFTISLSDGMQTYSTGDITITSNGGANPPSGVITLTFANAITLSGGQSQNLTLTVDKATQTDGCFVGLTGLTVNGSVSLPSYTWAATAPSDWTGAVWTTGTETGQQFASGSNAVFDDTAQATQVGITSAVTAHDVTVSGQDYTFNLSGDGASLTANALNVTSDQLTIQGGAVTTGTLTVADGASLALANGGTLSVTGDVTLTGSLNLAEGARLALSNANAAKSLMTENKLANSQGTLELSTDVSLGQGSAESTQAKGKLLVNGHKLTLGNSDGRVTSIASFDGVEIAGGGAIISQSSASIINNLKVSADNTGTLLFVDVNNSGDVIYNLNGVTSVEGTLNITNRWNANVEIAALVGNGMLNVRGNGSTSDPSPQTHATEGMIFAIDALSTESATFTGDLLIDHISDSGNSFDKFTVNTGSTAVNFRSLTVNYSRNKATADMALNLGADTTIGTMTLTSGPVNVTGDHLLTVGGITGAGNLSVVGNLTLNGAGVYAHTGALAIGGQLVKTGAGTQTLGSFAINETILVQGGTLTLNGTYSIDGLADDAGRTYSFENEEGGESSDEVGGFRVTHGTKTVYTKSGDGAVSRAEGTKFQLDGRDVEVDANGVYKFPTSADKTTLWVNGSTPLSYDTYYNASDSALTTAQVAANATLAIGTNAVGTLAFQENDTTINLTGTGTVNAISGTGTLNLDGTVTLGSSLTVTDGQTFGTSGAGTLNVGTLNANGGTATFGSAASISRLIVNGSAAATVGGSGAIAVNSTTKDQGVEIALNKSLTLVTANMNVAGTVHNNGSLTVGDGTTPTLVKTRYFVNGNNNGGTSSFNIKANATLVATGADSNDTHASGWVMGEWNNPTTGTVAGKLLAKDASIWGCDSTYTLNIENGGLVATKGVRAKKSDVAYTVNLKEGGTLVLGGTSTPNATVLNATAGSTIGTYAASGVDYSGGIATTAVEGKAVTLDTSLYTFSQDGTVIAKGDTAGALTISGAITGTAALAKVGAGTLTLTGANTYSGGTTVEAGTLQAFSLGTGDITVTGGTLELTSSITTTGALAVNGGTIKLAGAEMLTAGSLAVSGTVTFDLNNIVATKAGTITLATATGEATGDFSGVTVNWTTLPEFFTRGEVYVKDHSWVIDLIANGQALTWAGGTGNWSYSEEDTTWLTPGDEPTETHFTDKDSAVFAAAEVPAVANITEAISTAGVEIQAGANVTLQAATGAESASLTPAELAIAGSLATSVDVAATEVAASGADAAWNITAGTVTADSLSVAQDGTLALSGTGMSAKAVSGPGKVAVAEGFTLTLTQQIDSEEATDLTAIRNSGTVAVALGSSQNVINMDAASTGTLEVTAGTISSQSALGDQTLKLATGTVFAVKGSETAFANGITLAGNASMQLKDSAGATFAGAVSGSGKTLTLSGGGANQVITFTNTVTLGGLDVTGGGEKLVFKGTGSSLGNIYARSGAFSIQFSKADGADAASYEFGTFAMSPVSSTGNRWLIVDQGVTVHATGNSLDPQCSISSGWGVGNGGLEVNGILTTDGAIGLEANNQTAYIKGSGIINTAGLNLCNGSHTYIQDGITINITSNRGIFARSSTAAAGDVHLKNATLTATTADWEFQVGRAADSVTLEDTATGTTFDAANGHTITISKVLGGNGKLVKAGAGTVLLKGANTYSGGTEINAGTLAVAGNGAIGAVTIAQNGTLRMDKGYEFTGAVSGAGNLAYAGTAAATLNFGTQDISHWTGSFDNTSSAAVTLNINTTGLNMDITHTGTGLVNLGLGVDNVRIAGEQLVNNVTHNASWTTYIDATGAVTATGTVLTGRVVVGQQSTETDALFTLSGENAMLNKGGSEHSYAGLVQGYGTFKLVESATQTLTGDITGFHGTFMADGAGSILTIQSQLASNVTLRAIGGGEIILKSDVKEAEVNNGTFDLNANVETLAVSGDNNTLNIGTGTVENISLGGNLTANGDLTIFSGTEGTKVAAEAGKTMAVNGTANVDGRVKFHSSDTQDVEIAASRVTEPEQYALESGNFDVTADTVEKVASGDVEVANQVSAREVVNEVAEGTLSLTAGVNMEALKNVFAISGDIKFLNVDAETQATLDTLNIAEGNTVSFSTNGNIGEVPSEATVTVAGTLTAGAGATLNANLVMDGTTGSPAVLDVSAMGGNGGLNMGSSVTLKPGELSLSENDIAAVTNLQFKQMYDLFNGVEDFYVGDQHYGDTDVWVNAKDVFSNLASADKDYYLFFSGANQGGVGGNVGTIYILQMPEPTTGTLSLLALCALAARRRRK